MKDRIGELLVQQNLLSSDDLKRAQNEARATGTRAGVQLTKLGLIDGAALADFMSKQYGLPSIDLADFEIDPEVIELIPQEVALKHQVIPVNRAGSTLIIATGDPSNIFALDDIKFLTGYNTEVVVATEQAIHEAIDRYYDSAQTLDSVMSSFEEEDYEVVSEEQGIDVEELAKSTEEAPVVKLANLILTDAIKKNASDIHIETYERDFRVRYRIDGLLYEVMRPPRRMRNALTSRIKIMAKLDIAERRLPQDGRIKMKIGQNRVMDYRISVLPTLFGEKIVLRLLDKSNLQLDMTRLGFTRPELDLFQQAIHKPFGMVLVTGPTGSGKTTTLYSALSELNQISANISTAEDPVEFNLEGINQVNMKEGIGLTFAASLRSFLRQDPDIIMLGEIRDFETAEIAIKAALTGHMVLSTLHTNDAPSTITRLLNMGIEPFLVSSAVICVVAQRLARTICTACRERNPDVSAKQLLEAGLSPDEVKRCTPMRGVGCSACANTGFKGRIAVYEVLPVSDAIREYVLNGATAVEVKQQAIREGMSTLRRSALNHLLNGTTTVDEVYRVSVSDN
ncbi:MAG: type IV-A pilus assembly ATPase PilB [Myxococcales bacterium]|nr:type IV-A pilus assembly ATPase PilB [Myxococcales bacterium]